MKIIPQAYNNVKIELESGIVIDIIDNKQTVGDIASIILSGNAKFEYDKEADLYRLVVR